jgi:DNA polymerase-3 subunit delta
MARTTQPPPIVVISGDDEYQKAAALKEALDHLLPAGVDRALAYVEYDGQRATDQGGPSLAGVLDDLATLPFLAPQRVVLVHEADAFVTAHREKLERYLTKPAPTGTLILECRTFPKTTRLYKAATSAGGLVFERKKLGGRALQEFVAAEAAERGKRIAPSAVTRLMGLVGQDTGLLASEIEKLCLYAGERSTISEHDVAELVGQTREERIFAALDAAAAGRLSDALRLWEQVLATDPGAAFKAIGGIAYRVRQWLTAHRLLAEGLGISEIAPKVLMWGREQELRTILKRLSPLLLRRFLAAIADLDSQAKSGVRSIETGVELMLARLAAH